MLVVGATALLFLARWFWPGKRRKPGASCCGCPGGGGRRPKESLVLRARKNGPVETALKISSSGP